MKLFLTLCLAVLTNGLFAQKQTLTTDYIQIFGLVDSSFSISFETIAKQKPVKIGNFKVTNHLGEFKKEYKRLKGVPLLPILGKVKIHTKSPKELSEYYFVFLASDGYTVVFSWNEIFNTPIGQSLYIATEADGKPLSDSPERVLMIAAKDFRTGRRHIKGLSSIEVRRAEKK